MRWIQTSVVALLMGVNVSPVAGATYVWTGAASANWSDGGNWTNGTAPTSAGTDHVRLMPGKTPPANQDIAGLSIDSLTFNTNSAGYTVGGQTITLKRINCYDDNVTYETYDAGNYQTNMLNCNVVIAENNEWVIRPRSYLWINGSVGETNGSKQISGYSGRDGTLVLAGDNTFSGGLKNNMMTVAFSKDRNLGAVPGKPVTNYLESGYGRWRAVNTADFSRVTIHANRGVTIPGGQPALSAELNTKVVVNAPLMGNGSLGLGDTYREIPGDGVIVLAGDSASFTGSVCVLGGTLVLMHSNALGSAATGDLTGSGSYDFHGQDTGRSFPGVWNNTGVDKTGMIKNSNTAHPSTITGNIGFTYPSSLPFGGQGDIVLAGIAWSSEGGKLAKSGNGTLTLRGANTYTTDTEIHLGGLTLDYRVQNNTKIGTHATLSLSQAALRLIGCDSGASRQAVDALSIGGLNGVPAGASSITLQPGADQTLTLAVNEITVAEGNTVDFRIAPEGTGRASITTTTPDGLLAGGSATWNQSSWAKSAGGVIAGLSEKEYAPSFDGGTTGTHVDVPAGITTLSSPAIAQTLRFNASAGSSLVIAEGQTLTLNGINGPAPGLRPGILMTPKAGPVTISGPGIIEPGYNQVVYIQHYSASPLTLAACLSGTGLGVSLVKSGYGELILTGTNTHNGGNSIFGGTLTVNTISSNGVNSALGSSPSITIANGTLKYIGAAQAHDRVIGMRGPAALEASGRGVLDFTASTNATVVGDGRDFPLTLTGTGLGIMEGVLDLHMGDVIKDGPGTWTIGGVQNYTGNTVVSNGTLRLVNNCVLARSLAVMPRGTLAGSATVLEDLELHGTRCVEIRSDTDYDTLVVGYDTTLGGTLELVEMNGYKLPANVTLTILTTGGSITGAFSSATGGFTVMRSRDGRKLLVSKRQ